MIKALTPHVLVKIAVGSMPGAFLPTEVPMGAFIPSEMPKEGDTLLWLPAATYLNYLVNNGVVLLPTYAGIGASKETEESVMKIVREQPDRSSVVVTAVPRQPYPPPSRAF